jgi:multiple sugar transport system permease protein
MRTKVVFSRTAFYTIITLLVLVYLVPVSWPVSMSLRTNQNLLRAGQWIPDPITFEHYSPGLMDALPELPRYFFNTFRIAFLSTIGSLLSCSLAGYALARWHFPLKNVWFMLLLATMMVPGHVTLIPLYVMFRKLHWLNTPYPLIVPAFFGNAYGTFFFRQFFLNLPREVEEAAKIDGAGAFRIYWNIVVPLTKPAFIALGVLNFTASWNGFFAPIIYLQRPQQWVLTQAVRSMMGRYDSPWGEIMAAVVLMTLPIILLYIFVQRYFEQGITLTGTKG